MRGWLVAACVVLLTGCSAGGPSGSDPSGSTPTLASPAPQTVGERVEVSKVPWQLRDPVSRPVAVGTPGGVEVAGGLSASGSSTRDARTYDPRTGRVVQSDQLAVAVHDAAGAWLGGRALVIGGGDTSVGDTVQAVGSGRSSVIARLPKPRADLASATLTGSNGKATAYVFGGYDGMTADRSVLATTDGTSFTSVARLAVGVRYPAVAALGNTLWVFGGEVAGRPVSLVQRVDLATGRSTVAGRLPRPLEAASAFVLDGQVFVAGGLTVGDGRMATVWRLQTGRARLRPVAELPLAASDMGAAVVGGSAYLVGGEGPGPLRQVVRVSLVVGPSSATSGSAGAQGAGWLGPADVPAHLAPGSDPGVLPGPVLIADKLNDRLLVVDPEGRVRWQFPRPGDLRPGQSFRVPDDAFFSPDGKRIIATEEDDFVVSVIDIATHRIVYRYGRPGSPGSGPNRLDNPDDAFLLPGGGIVSADIKNCRIVRIGPNSHHVTQQYGTTGHCIHAPPVSYGSPNGAFPMRNGDLLVTEINGSWIDEVTPAGKRLWSVHVPAVAYPSDTNEVRPGLFVTVDYSSPGQVLEMTSQGRVRWRWRPSGAHHLDHPSLGRPLPNGDVLVTDDYRHRILVVDPRTDRVVWQYGHTDIAGRGPGYLDNPDGLDLVAPNSEIGVLGGR